MDNAELTQYAAELKQILSDYLSLTEKQQRRINMIINVMVTENASKKEERKGEHTL